MPAAGARAYATPADPLRVMIVDDSIVARSIVTAIVDGVRGAAVVAAVASAERALATLATTPVDVVLLDLALPGMDGLAALPEILKRSGDARVIVVSGSAARGADAAVRALTLGAADTIEKPAAGFTGDFRAELSHTLVRLAADRRVRPAAPPAAAADPLAQPVAGPIACLAVGASTGGLHALSALFAGLPPAFRAPILVTQHLPAAFMPYFARQLADLAGRPARVAATGERLLPGAILVAPGDAHLTVRRGAGGGIVALDATPAPSGCLPSVDPMFDSVAACFGTRGFAVVLSGMGRDGAIGARAIVAAGGEVAAQDRRTSVVWGMPGTVAAAGLAATIAEPSRIAARIAARAA